MNKRILSVFISLVMLLTSVSFNSTLVFASEETQTITVTLDGKVLTFDQNPIIVNSRTLVPLRAIFEGLGASVSWNQDTQTVTSVKGDTTISMTIGKTEMRKNGEVITLDVAPQIVGNRTLVPVRAVAESFNCLVDWNGETQTVIINTVGIHATPEEEARKTAQAFLDALASFEFEKIDELVTDPDKLPAEIKEFDIDAEIDMEIELLTEEFSGYEDDFREIFDIVIDKAKSEIKYEINDVKENNGNYIFTGTLILPNLDSFDYDAYMEESFNEDAIASIAFGMVLRGEITSETTEEEMMKLLMPVIIDAMKESMKGIDFSKDTFKEEFVIVVVKRGEKWLVEVESSIV